MPSVSIEELTHLTQGHTAPGSFLETVRAHPKAPALRSRRGPGAGSWEMWTFEGYAERVADAAAGLRAAGVRPGDRVVLLMANRPDFHWLDLAAQFLRATPVSIYNTSSVDEIEYIVGHTEARVAIVENAEFLRRLLAARPSLPKLERIFVIDPPPELLPAGVIPAGELYLRGRLDLEALAGAVQPTDVATLIYTSGTTGPAKGVMITQANVVYTVEQLRRCADWDDTVGLRVVSYLPMAHIAERMTSHYQAMVLGFDVYCCPDPGLLAPYLREVHPEILFGVPRVWEKLRSAVLSALAATPERSAQFDQAVQQALMIRAAQRAGTAADHQIAMWHQLDTMAFASVRTMLGLDSLHAGITGAAPIAKDVLEWFDAIGVPLSEIYGMSESSGPITWSPLANRPGFVGRALPGCEVQIAADGEVCARGGNVFAGYFRQPERTAETIVDGWLHTGDIGELDPEGYLRIVDRKKELIITSGGKNISPANLEAALTTIPLVGFAAAIGDQRKYVSALLVLDPDAASAWAARHGHTDVTLAQLARDPELIAEIAAGVATVNRQFAKAERIKTFTIIGEHWKPGSDLLTPTSKLKRRGVLARYGAEIDAMYGPDPTPVPAPARPVVEAATAAAVGALDAPLDGADADFDAELGWAEDAPTQAITATDPTPAGLPPVMPPVDGPPARPFVPFDGADDYDDPDEDGVVWADHDDEPGWFRRWWWAIAVAIIVAGLAAVVVITMTSDNDIAPRTTLAPITATPTTVAPTAVATTAAPTTSAAATTSGAPSTSAAPLTLLSATADLADLATFSDAIEAAGLQADLEVEGPVTLFAPTDEAFAKLPPEQLAALLADRAALVRVLRHHLVDGSIYVEDLQDGPLAALDGTPIEITAVEDLTVGGGRLVETDRTAVNGVIHTIDTVLLPPDLDLSTLAPVTTTSAATTSTSLAETGKGTDFSVPFEAGSGLLNRTGRALVEQAAATIKLLPTGSVVVVTGVTDDNGTSEQNAFLASLRANSVVIALRQAGAKNVTYVVETLEESPKSGNESASWRADIDIP